MSLEIEEECFTHIIDPETNKNVLLESAVGQQVIKNYIECLRNGPDSENILSTKMFYSLDNTETEVKTNSIENIFEYAKNLECTQFSGKELKDIIKGSRKKTPMKGNKVWIRRSSGKWQRAVIAVVSLDDNEDTKCNVCFKTNDGKIASKKGLDISDILFY